MNTQILLADGNDEPRKEFGVFLKSKGFKVFIVNNGAYTLNTAIKESIDIIILDVDLPVISGEKVLQILKVNPFTKSIPFLFMSSGRKSIKGFRRNLDDLLLKPFNNSEILNKIDSAILRAKVKNGDSNEEKVIEGDLLFFSLADLLQILTINRREGVLKIFAGEGSDLQGNVFLKDGVLLNATLDLLENKKALFRLLTWQEGSFEFHPMHVKTESKFSTSTSNLVMEGLRQFDELKRMRELFPDDEATLKTRIPLAKLPPNMNPVACDILCLLDTCSTVKEIIEKSSYPDLETYEKIAELISKNILEEIKALNKLNDAQKFEYSGSLFTPHQAIKIREGLLNYWEGIDNMNSAKVFILSTHSGLTSTFVDLCGTIKEFTSDSDLPPYDALHQDFFGELGSIKIIEASQVYFFALPLAKNMRPIWKTFSHNVMGLIILWNNEGNSEALDNISKAKRFLCKSKRMPVVHVFLSAKPMDGREVIEFRRALDIEDDEKIFVLHPKAPERLMMILYNLFGSFMKMAV